MDDGSLNIIPVIFAFSWIFSDKKYGCCFNQILNFIPVIFAFSWIFVNKKYVKCFIMNIIPVNFEFSWIFSDKKYGFCFNQLHSGHFYFLMNIFWQKILTMLHWTSFRSFLHSPEYFLTKNMDVASIIFSTSFRSFLLSPEYLPAKNMDNASSWTSFRSFLRVLEYLLKNNGFCFNQLHSGHFYFLLNIFWQQIWTVIYWTSFRSFLHSPEYFLRKNMDVSSINFILVMFAFSWIFLDKKYRRCFTEPHSGHFCVLLNIFWQQIMDVVSIHLIPVIFAFSWIFFDNKYGRCFTELYSGNFCCLNISHWHCLNQVHFCIFLNISWEKCSPFKSQTIVESIKTKRKKLTIHNLNQ